MFEEGGFHLDRANPVGGDFDHLIGAAGKPDEAVVIDVGRVSCVIDPWNALPIVTLIALGIAPERLNQPREWTLDDHNALFAGGAGGALWSHDGGLDAGQRNPPRAWLDG